MINTEIIHNKIQEELYLFLCDNEGKSFTPEYLYGNNFREYTLRKIKYNLTKLRNKDIGVDEQHICIYETGYVYSNGYYWKKPNIKI